MFGRLFSGREKKLYKDEVLSRSSKIVETDTAVGEGEIVEASKETGKVLSVERNIEREDISIFKTELSNNSSIEDLLSLVVNSGASELYISPDTPPYIRINGKILKLDFDPITEDKIKEILEQVCSEEMLEDLDTSGEVGFPFEINELSRFRVNVFKQYGGYGAVFKRISSVIETFHNLNLSPVLEKIALLERGLVIISGPSESGITTTMASIIDYINSNRNALIVTIENPVEFVHKNKKSVIIHREIGTNVYSFKEGLQAALKEDPDVIYIAGDLKDAEVALLALKASEMGALVFCSLHLDGSAKVIRRFIDFFPHEKGGQIALRLSKILKAVICQKLVVRHDNNGFVPAVEIMVNNKKIAELIKKGHIEKLNSLITKSKKQGMQTINDALLELFEWKVISSRVAREHGCEISEASSE